jgi:hypothetical protein
MLKVLCRAAQAEPERKEIAKRAGLSKLEELMRFTSKPSTACD